MLSAAKHLKAHHDRPFAALRVTWEHDHDRPFAALRACPERSEWGDKKGPPEGHWCYPEEDRAVEVLTTLKQLRSKDLIDLDDAFYVTKDKEGDTKVHHSVHITRKGAGWGALGGLLVGALFFTPIALAVVGAAAGVLFVKLADMGIDQKFVKDLSAELKPNSSAIFLLVRNVSPDEVIAALRPYGGTILQTTLSEEAEEDLKANLQASQES